MEHSSTYIAVRKMIRHGLLVVIFPQFTQTLALLQEKGQITESEQEDLRQLAEEMNAGALIH